MGEESPKTCKCLWGKCCLSCSCCGSSSSLLGLRVLLLLDLLLLLLLLLPLLLPELLGKRLAVLGKCLDGLAVIAMPGPHLGQVPSSGWQGMLQLCSTWRG